MLVALAALAGLVVSMSAVAGQDTVNGWYEGEEIYYIDGGLEAGVTQRGGNDIYLIGGNRVWQAQVVEFVPGEAGYTPHWNVNIVHTASGVTVDDIRGSGLASEHFPEALFDDVAAIRAAESAGLVTIITPGVVVLCPIIPGMGADAPGHNQVSEDFPRPWPMTF